MSKIIDQLNQVLAGAVKEQVSLKDFTRLGVGGPAEFFYQAKSTSQLAKAKQFANMQGIPYTILKSDDNILITDSGLAGLVIYQGQPQIEREKTLRPLFADIKLDNDLLTILKNKGVDLGKYSSDNFLPVAILLDEIELDKKQVGGAQVALENANCIVNTGKASASDVVILLSLIKQQVRDRFGIQLIEVFTMLGN